MKKKTIANLIMVVIILAIAAGGILGVGYIRGWFDKADETAAVLTNIRGIVNMERNGVIYPAQSDTVLRGGDRIFTQAGAAAVIALGEDTVTLGSNVTITVKEPSAAQLSVLVNTGEIFVNTVRPVTLSFEAGEIVIADATAALSVRSGAQTVSIFRGTVGGAAAGETIEYVGEESSVGAIQLSGLNDFLIAQIREANKTELLCYTDQDLDELARKRQEALQELINGQQKPTEHTHNYSVNVVAPGCATGGYTEHTCDCGDTYTDSETEAVGHSWNQWSVIKEPTIQEEGLQERRCRNCDVSEQKTIAKVAESHTHSYTAEVVAPTCTADGYTMYTCACGVSYTDSIVAAVGHRYESSVIAPACTVQGYTRHTCQCGAVYTDSVTEAAGHKWGNWVTVKEPTSEEEGLQERKCQSCGAQEQAALAVKQPGTVGSVYLTIRCDTILNNMEDLEPGKEEFVPADGIILPTVEVPFNEGETVFDVLVRVCELADIQIEYSWTPIYDSYYIESINHLYEMDCGEQSGWMYKVNEWFPNYGCSSYSAQDGDVIVFTYTCQGFGADVGKEAW